MHVLRQTWRIPEELIKDKNLSEKHFTVVKLPQLLFTAVN